MVHTNGLPPQVHKSRRDWYNLHSMLPFLWEFRGRALFAMLCLVFSKMANVGVPMALKVIIDYYEQASRTKLTIVMPLLLLLAYGLLKLGASLFNELRDVVFAKVRYRAMRRLSTRVFEHLLRLSLRYHLERKTGAISRDLERGTRSVSQILNYMAFSILPIVVEFSLVAAIMLHNYDSVFAGAMFGSVVLYMVFTFLVTEWRMDFRHHMNELDSRGNSIAFDSLINYETVKYFGNERLELHRYDDTLEQWEHWAVKSQNSMSLLNFGQGAIIALSVILVMVLAARSVSAGEMHIGDLVMVNAFLLQLFIPLGFLGIVYRQIKYALADMDLVFKLLDTEPEIRDTPNACLLKVHEGSIRFEHVDFSYQSERQILHDVSFEVPPGHKVAVVGYSGAGKSTLSRLIFRFYDVQAGCVCIDGQDVREVSQESLHTAIGIVPQDTVLFNDSLYFNVAYGRPEASREEVVDAARMACILDFIERLPDGWDTVVGERGLKLSGGEKQRVAIARAILKRPRILIFDEATSSLDTHTEKAIQQTLEAVAVDRTTLVIAHRLSTVVDADQILVMNQGRIVERGTHAELLSTGSDYKAMWELQQQESAEKETEKVAET